MYKLTENQISSGLADQTSILDHQAGIYYGLNEVGTHIWEILKKSPADFETLLASVMNEFDIDETTCRKDLQEILKGLADAKLVEKI